MRERMRESRCGGRDGYSFVIVVEVGSTSQQ